MKTAVIYARYSCSSQTEQSIEGQLNVCNAYAKANELLIVDTYIDRATTGTNDNRAGFQKMLKDSESAKWDVVLVYAIDRFGRNSTEIAINKQRLKKNGKVLISATQRTSDNIDGTKNLDGILLENVYIGIAEYYSAELSQKIRRGQNESRKKGQYCGGSIPYGYYSENKFIKIDEEKAEVVRFIFAEYARGQNVPQIICKINEKGILHKGRPFLPNALYSILRNERYVGIYRWNDEVYTNIYPQIVDTDTFNKVKRRLDLNKSGKKPTKAIYLLRNKIKCGYCGLPISAESGTSHTGAKKFYYKCIGRKKYKTNCEKTPIRKDILENIVLDNIIRSLSDEAELDKIINGILAEQNKGENSTLKYLLKEQKQTEIALNNILNAIEQGIISNITNKRLHELETKQNELSEKIAIEQAKSTILLTKSDIRQYYELALRLEPQMLINYLIKEIVLYNDKIRIIFNSPVKMSPDESRGFTFYTQKEVIRIYMGYKQEYDEYETEIILSVS